MTTYSHKITCLSLGALAALLLAESARAAEDTFILGVQTHYGQFWEPYDVSLPLIEQAGIGWIRDELYWTKVEEKKGTLALPDYYRRYLDETFRRKIQPMLILVFNHQDYDGGRFPSRGEALEGYLRYCEFIVKSVPQVKIVEVWNEINIDGKEWGRSSDAKGVADLLKALYPRLKKVRPDLIIVGPNLYGGEPDENLKKVFEHGVINCVDGVSLHPYGNPDTQVGRLERLQSMLRTFNGGKDKPLYLTEYGWTTAWGYDTEYTQARSIARSLLSVRSLPYVKGAWLYNSVDCTVKESHVWHPEFTEDNFGLMKNDFTPKPAYGVLRDLAPVIRQGKFIERKEYSFDGADSQKVRTFEFAIPDGRRACGIWQTNANWGSWCTIEVLEPEKPEVELLKLGTGVPVRRTLDKDGTVPMFLAGDDIPWLIFAKGKGIRVKQIKWVKILDTPAPKVAQTKAGRFIKKPRIDGDLTDWPAEAFTELGNPIWNAGDEKWSGKSDLSGRFALGWDDQTFFLAVEAIDNVHHQPKSYTDLYEGDCLQAVWLVPGDSQSEYVEIGLARTHEGEKTVWWNLPLRLVTESSKAMITITRAVRVEPGKTTYELAIPIASGLMGDPATATTWWKANATFRFSLAVNDNDGKERKQACAWTKGIIEEKDPTLYGQAVLKP